MESGAIRIARKEYKCRSGPYHVCNQVIRPNEPYFAFTIAHPNRYITHRYCIECGERLHPELVRTAGKEIRSERKREAVNSRTAKLKFLKSKAIQFKRKPSSEEQFLWEHLKSGKLGERFEYQVPLQGYIVDFWCPAKQLVVELDGASHRNRKEKDLARDTAFQERGIQVLRFPSRLVFHDIEFILTRIKEALRKA